MTLTLIDVLMVALVIIFKEKKTLFFSLILWEIKERKVNAMETILFVTVCSFIIGFK